MFYIISCREKNQLDIRKKLLLLTSMNNYLLAKVISTLDVLRANYTFLLKIIVL